MPEPAASFIRRRLLSSSTTSFLVCIATVTAVLYWRRPDAFYNPQLWAEDGEVFFTEAFFRGAGTLALPTMGYFHLLARVVAWIGSWMPIPYAPHWYGFASWALLVSIVGYLFSSRFVIGNWLRFLLGLALVVNAADNEVFFNLSNWATITSFFWLLLAVSNEPQSKSQAHFDIALLALAGLNCPFVVCLWPLFLMRWYVRRTAHSRLLFSLSLIVATIQIWNMPARLEEVSSFSGWESLTDVLVYRFGFMFFGESIYRLDLTAPFRIGALLIIGGFYGGLAWHGVKRRNWALVTILGGGLLASVLSLSVNRSILPLIIHSAGRHFVLPAITTTWALLLSDLKPRHLRALPLALLLVAFLFLTPGTKKQVFPDLDWAAHVARCGSAPTLCRIPVQPVMSPLNWFAYLHFPAFAAPQMQTTFPSRFGNEIELLGYDAAQDRTAVELRLVWHALGSMRTDYRFHLQLVSLEQRAHVLALAREEPMPLESAYPTSKWVAGEIVAAEIGLSLNSVPPGRYQIQIGWSEPESATARLVAHDQSLGRDWEDGWAVLPLVVTIPFSPAK